MAIHTELRNARKQYEELFCEKPSSTLTAFQIREFINEANQQFEREFP